MRYLVKINELKEKIDFFEKQLLIIDENIEKLEKIKPTIIWEGEASNKFDNVYNNYILELKAMGENIIKHVEFLMSFYEKYNDGYNSLRNKYKNILNRRGIYEQDNIQ